MDIPRLYHAADHSIDSNDECGKVAAMGFDILAARAALPATEASAYFNAGTFGPLPQAAHEAMVAHSHASYTRGRIGSGPLHGWLDDMALARSAFGAVLGVSEAELALMHCTTDAVNTVLWGTTWEAGDEVLTTTHEHPGLTAPLAELARVHGVKTRAVAPEHVARELRPETRMVALSHVLWTTGDVLPLETISAAARAHGGRTQVLVDGAQSTGAIPVDLHGSGVDFYTVSGQKWFCGPSGTGALWVHPRALASLATPWPWYLSKNRFVKPMEEWTTSQRLDATTLSMTSLAGLIAALRWYKVQADAGALEAAARQSAVLRARLAENPRVEVIPVQHASSIVSFKIAGVDAQSAAERLEARGILVRSIPGFDYVRASVGFWNNETDVARLVDAVASV